MRGTDATTHLPEVPMLTARKAGHFCLAGMIVAGSLAWSFCLAYATSCTCSDICNIDNVASEARGAQWEYQIQIALLRNQDQDSMFPTWFTPGRYEQVQKAVQSRINSVSSRSACSPPLDTIRSDTNGGNCAITTQAQTACIKEFAMAHETVHQKSCQSFSHILTYQMSMSLEDVLAEEITAYQTAIDMRNTLRAGPLKDCCCENKCTPTGAGAAKTLGRIFGNLVR